MSHIKVEDLDSDEELANYLVYLRRALDASPYESPDDTRIENNKLIIEYFGAFTVIIEVKIL